MRDLLQTTDAEIDEYLEAADPMTLRGLVYQLTGDPAIATTPLGEVPGLILPVPGIVDPAAIAFLRSSAASLLRAHRDAGAPPIDHGPTERLRESLSLAVGQDIPEAALELCVEELALQSIPRRHELRHKPEGIENFHVIVIGAGIGGINAAVCLNASGIPFTVLDKNSDVGGTWHDNRYPGCRVDVPSRAYSHSFGLKYPWQHWFAPQAENNRYMHWCVDTYGVHDRIRFDTEVTALTWDETAAKWCVEVKDAEGQAETLTANAVISAVGFLSRPKLPTLEGIETFQGPAFHTAWWDEDVEPAGQHFTVIGTGCSGMQLVPELERLGARVTVFQRQPSWIFEVPIYRSELPEGMRWLDQNLPYYRNFEKFRTMWLIGDHIGGVPYWKDLDWHDADSWNEVQHRAREASVGYLTRKLGDRPKLLQASLPRYPTLCSRPVLDNGWLDALRSPNVELVTEPIARIAPEGVVTEGGRTIEADILVFATGFQTSKFLWPMEVVGRHGSLDDLWAKDGARAYLGITMPGFPNLFCIYGPNTNSAQGTLPTMSADLQTRYAIECIDELFRTRSAALDVTQDAYDEYNRRLDEGLAKTIFSDPRLNTYFINEHGRTPTQTCWPTLEYWKLTRRPDVSHYQMSGTLELGQ